MRCQILDDVLLKYMNKAKHAYDIVKLSYVDLTHHLFIGKLYLYFLSYIIW